MQRYFTSGIPGSKLVPRFYSVKTLEYYSKIGYFQPLKNIIFWSPEIYIIDSKYTLDLHINSYVIYFVIRGIFNALSSHSLHALYWYKSQQG